MNWLLFTTTIGDLITTHIILKDEICGISNENGDVYVRVKGSEYFRVDGKYFDIVSYIAGINVGSTLEQELKKRNEDNF